jgi:hypothetical protein
MQLVGRYVTCGAKSKLSVFVKGVDVLVALALVREAADPNVGLVILASHDTDLAPALDAGWTTATSIRSPGRTE